MQNTEVVVKILAAITRYFHYSDALVIIVYRIILVRGGPNQDQLVAL